MKTVNSLLAEHVSFRVTSVDRIGVAGYIRDLVYEGGLVRFLLHRASLVGKRNIPSPALLGHNHDRLTRELEGFVRKHELPVVRFRRGDNKEEIARPYQLAAAAQGRPGVVLVGKAQERMDVWRGWVDKDSPRSTKSHPHFCFSRQSAVPDHWYFYLWDDRWGPAFVKLSTYAPFGLWISANGNEWAKRELARAGIAFTELDNGLRDVADPRAARRVCARLGSGHLRGLIDRWLPSLPSPLTRADQRAGFTWSFSVRQLEIADTAVFDRPAAGRAWFEAAIRDHLDLGRPDRVKIVFDRKIFTRGKHQTPGSFATEVITPGTRPRIEIRYKTSKAKAYLKEGRALRVETTINNPAHFDCRKTLNAENWRALRRVGQDVNARFLAALGEGNDHLPDVATLEAIVLPSTHDGQRASALRLGDPRAMALLASVASFEHVTKGLTNKGLREHMADLYDSGYSSAQATYDLRRLRLKGFIQRVSGTHSYAITALGHAIATLFIRLTARVIVPGLTALEKVTRPPRQTPAPLRAAWRAYDAEVKRLIANAGLAA
ncbi:MAG: hypothetical protein ACRDKZ_00170 [Actinomycetota bacterium]